MDSYRERALRLFPAGSNGEFGIPPELIPVLARGKGPKVWDSEGREYLDMTMAWGAALPGHAHPPILEAAARQALEGANFAAVSTRMVELAEKLASLMPGLERLRFVASGTEATMLCLRIARAATGRRKVLKFEGAYHGQHPEGVASMIGGSYPTLPAVDPSGAGAQWVEGDLLAAPYNDAEATEAIIAAHSADLAAVIVEPLHRCLAPKGGFLTRLREITRKHGVVLVFDEVVTGFRLAPGGARSYYGVIPDLAAYGKALGGGFPLGAYGGTAEIMEAVNEHRLPGPKYAWSASTTGGNPVSCAASLAAMELYSSPGFHDRLHANGRLLRCVLSEAASNLGVPAQVLGDGPLAQLAFSATPVVDQRSWSASNRVLARRWMLELLKQGVFLNPMGTKLYLSHAHDEADIRRFGELAWEALKIASAAAA